MVFTPIKFKRGKRSANRLAVAPMTTQQSHSDGSLSREEADWLIRLSEDGFGIVISCAASISDTSTAFYNQLSLAHDEYIPGLTILANTMKQHGSLNIIQLCHAGSRANEALTGEKPHSASSYLLPMIPDFVPPVALSQQQINQIAADFAMACARAEKAGFDGVEIHGANGYLFTQFISTMTNLRTDEYGGDLGNRARFSREVARACRNAVSADFLIGFRLSFEGAGIETGLDIDENIQIANWLAQDGIDYIHSSQLDYAVRTNKYPQLTTISYLRDQLSSALPLIVSGSINSMEAAQKAMELGADVVAIGRAAIGNKKVPAYFKKHQPLPHQTPFSIRQLQDIGISEAFIDYIKNAPPLRSLNIVH
ncbi:MAG: tRNA-dihydrouridine synthase [Saprospiraceae bacterium]|nr:tRNA-dihydrouridine synthase [Saprospiraceae bacterium]MCB9320764.1 tRNA-dihydrouridine synthase [Lewinellaceae bacterium]